MILVLTKSRNMYLQIIFTSRFFPTSFLAMVLWLYFCWIAPTERVLMERDIAKLLNLMHNFSDKWNEIGLGLGFVPSELRQISSNPSLFMHAPASFLTTLLSQWAQWPTEEHSTKPTLEALCEALRGSLVGLGRLAEQVEKELKYSSTGKDSFL